MGHGIRFLLEPGRGKGAGPCVRRRDGARDRDRMGRHVAEEREVSRRSPGRTPGPTPPWRSLASPGARHPGECPGHGVKNNQTFSAIGGGDRRRMPLARSRFSYYLFPLRLNHHTFYVAPGIGGRWCAGRHEIRPALRAAAGYGSRAVADTELSPPGPSRSAGIRNHVRWQDKRSCCGAPWPRSFTSQAGFFKGNRLWTCLLVGHPPHPCRRR